MNICWGLSTTCPLKRSKYARSIHWTAVLEKSVWYWTLDDLCSLVEPIISTVNNGRIEDGRILFDDATKITWEQLIPGIGCTMSGQSCQARDQIRVLTYERVTSHKSRERPFCRLVETRNFEAACKNGIVRMKTRHSNSRFACPNLCIIHEQWAQ